jgi:hypothetical protein
MLQATREREPALTWAQWWARLEAKFWGDPLATAMAEWRNHHLEIHGGALNLAEWRIFEGKFRKLRQRVPVISEEDALQKVIDNLPA